MLDGVVGVIRGGLVSKNNRSYRNIVIFNFIIIALAFSITLFLPQPDLTRCSTIPTIETSFSGSVSRMCGIVVLIFTIANIYFIVRWCHDER